VAGAGVVLLFGILLALRMGLGDGGLWQHGDGSFQPVTAATTESDSWLAISQEGRKIGHANRSFSRTDQGYRFTEVVVMQINTMGIVQRLTVRTAATLNPDRSLVDFHFDLASNLFRFTARGTVSGKVLTVLLGAPGQERENRLDLAEPIYLGGGIMAVVGAQEFKTGEGGTFPLFDPASLGQRPLRVIFLGEEAVSIGGKLLTARKYNLEFMGMKQSAWIDREGTVLKEEGLLGITLERVSREEALAGMGDAATSDLVELAAIPSLRPIEQPEGVKGLSVRLTGLDDAFFALHGDRQHYRDGVLTIRREAMLPGSLPRGEVERDFAAFLAPTPLVQSDHPKIQKQVRNIIAPGDAPEEKAGKIMDWIFQSLEKRPVLSVPNAVQILENRVGDCNEHAVLMTAMARAAGIPATVEAGLVYQRGRFYYHAWNALYLSQWGGWVTADATLGQFPADVTHIRLVRGEADRQLDLLGLIGRLKIEILEVVR
jgi:hypothetical protein